MPFPDVSEVLVGEALIREDDTWIRLIHEKQHLAELLNGAVFANVLEIGCGTGLYAGILHEQFPNVSYLGIDASLEMIAIARRRNPSLTFVRCDFREFESSTQFDLVCAHAFLKHFSIDDWVNLFPKFLSLAGVAQFDMQTADLPINDGSPKFGNNLWVPRALLDKFLDAAGHKVISEEIAYEHDDRRATIFLTSSI